MRIEVIACVQDVAVCAASCVFSGLMVTMSAIPPFIVTLAMMLVARGLACILAEGHSISEVFESSAWWATATTWAFPTPW